MNVLVTGGSGFLGTEIIKKLISRKYNVYNLDLIESNLHNVKNFKINILDIKSIKKLFQDFSFDLIIHSCAKVPISATKQTFHEINVNGTKNILNFSIKHKVKRFVYISSSAVYGVPKKVPIKEDDPREPIEPYGLSKKIGEDICMDQMQNISLAIVRPRTVIGSDRLGIFSILFEWIKNGSKVPVLNNGKNLYQFIDVEELADAIVLTSLSNYVGSLNIGSDKFSSIRDLLENLIKKNKSNSKIKNLDSNFMFRVLKFMIKYKFVPLKEYHYLAYGKNIYFDTSLSKKILNWDSKISNLDSLQNSYQNFLNSSQLNSNNVATHKKLIKSFILRHASKLL